MGYFSNGSGEPQVMVYMNVDTQREVLATLQGWLESYDALRAGKIITGEQQVRYSRIKIFVDSLEKVVNRNLNRD